MRFFVEIECSGCGDLDLKEMHDLEVAGTLRHKAASMFHRLTGLEYSEFQKHTHKEIRLRYPNIGPIDGEFRVKHQTRVCSHCKPL